jgi:hypothetical protein
MSLPNQIVQLSLSSLNLSKSTYVCIDFAANRFFSAYSFQGQGQFREKFHCYLNIRVRPFYDIPTTTRTFADCYPCLFVGTALYLPTQTRRRQGQGVYR